MAQSDHNPSKLVFIATDVILAIVFIAAIVTTSLTLTTFFAAPSAPGAAVLTTATFIESTTEAVTNTATETEGPTVPTTATQASTVTTEMATSAQGSVLAPSQYIHQLMTSRILPRYYGYAALLSWAIFAGALVWRGHVRSVWSQSRFSYDTFSLLVRMRGAQTRLRLMHNLDGPRNKLQLASALGLDWKAVDKHVQVLQRNGLVQPTATSGTATFYELTEKGKRALQVLEELGVDGEDRD